MVIKFANTHIWWCDGGNVIDWKLNKNRAPTKCCSLHARLNFFLFNLQFNTVRAHSADDVNVGARARWNAFWCKQFFEPTIIEIELMRWAATCLIQSVAPQRVIALTVFFLAQVNACAWKSVMMELRTCARTLATSFSIFPFESIPLSLAIDARVENKTQPIIENSFTQK